MTVRAFLKWYANYILGFIKDIDFDSKVTFVTFSAMIPIVIILGLSHIDARVGLGAVFGTLLSVGVLLMHKDSTNKNAITNHLELQEQQSGSVKSSVDEGSCQLSVDSNNANFFVILAKLCGH